MKTKSFFLGCFVALIFSATIATKLAAQCAANFTFSVNSASVQFTDASTGYAIPEYTWDFGDSHLDYTANPTHFYNAAGTYTVCLTVHDSLSLCQNTTCQLVTVTAGCNNLTASAASTPATACQACDGTVTGYVTGG